MNILPESLHPHRLCPSGPLNRNTALDFAARLEHTGLYQCRVESYPLLGTVLEVREPVRPFALILRCQTVEHCRPLLPDAPPALPTPTRTIPEIITEARAHGCTFPQTLARVRDHGHAIGNVPFRAIWHATPDPACDHGSIRKRLRASKRAGATFQAAIAALRLAGFKSRDRDLNLLWKELT